MVKTKIVVLDDDPTGIQTVHDINVLMNFELENLIAMMQDPDELVYLSTNSRSLLPTETEALHRTLIQNLTEASKRTLRDFLVISRGDSTLRGHYPLESEVIKSELLNGGKVLRGEVLCPYLEGIRKTEEDIHYVLQYDQWVPCAQTEFAKDKTFGYFHSNLCEYVNEKYKKKMPCLSIGTSLLDGHHNEDVLELLNNAPVDVKIILNASCIEHLMTFVDIIEPIKERYQYRTAASFVKAFAHVESRPLLEMESLCDCSNSGGLILAGSHVKKTTEQIECLLESGVVECLQFDVTNEDDTQIDTLSQQIDERIRNGKNVLLMTSRDQVEFSEDTFEQLLAVRKVSERFVSVLKQIKVRPRFLISKGGITSYDVLKKGLNMTSGRVLGQVYQNIPVVRLNEDALYGNLCVVVFPGNVGSTETLRDLVYNATKDC